MNKTHVAIALVIGLAVGVMFGAKIPLLNKLSPKAANPAA